MRLNELLQNGKSAVRKSIWASPEAYLRFHLKAAPATAKVKYFTGPWVRLWDRPTQELIGVETPQELACLGTKDEDDDWEEFTGPFDRADTDAQQAKDLEEK